MSEIHKKTYGLCYMAQVPPPPPNWILLGYLKATQQEKQYRKEWEKNFPPEGKNWWDCLEYTFCLEHSELENV